MRRFATRFSIPHVFSPHTPASADQVNANFSALEDQVLYLKQQIEAQQAQIASLQSDLSAIQGSRVMALDPYLDLADVPDTVMPGITYPTVRFPASTSRSSTALAAM